jgi:heme-degrading monooxygenase HmoA
MFIAMNRFKVKKDECAAFEEVWLTRDSRLTEVPGFETFHLLRGPEHFRAAHAAAGERRPLTLGHPEFEGFEVVQSLENPKQRAAE